MPDSDQPDSHESATTPTPSANTYATSVSPDISEAQTADRMEDAIPPETFHQLPIVGLGGSAGSLAPLQTFFAQAPADSGMAFVVVLHLSPDHESSLAEILQQVTPMPVTQIRDKVRLEANHVYVIPPGKHLLMTDGQVTLADIERERGKRVAVDLFFRTLADTHGPNAVAIVLSGADADGAIGIKRIKERGGLTIAQDPQEAEQGSMPRSAIATGMVDLVLRTGEMAPRLVEFRRNGDRLQLPDFGAAPMVAARTRDEDEQSLREILSMLRAQTGRDFAGYKRATVVRRIARRMQVNGTPDLAAYHAFLRTHRGETTALLQDMLISVTNFFRDRDAFERLRAMLPELFRGKGPADTVRAWVAGCATGEEAYSIAILLAEYAAELEAAPQVQVFATDIDESAIAKARLAQYPETIVADVSEEHLRRFFVRQKDHYRVTQSVRELVLFAVHDVLRDAPFSRLDLVSCRNLLIYFTRETQRRVFDVFHFSLRPDGCLFLGTSETTDDVPDLFTPIDKKNHVYRRLSTPRSAPPAFTGPPSITLALGNRAGERIALPARGAPGAANERLAADGISVSEFHLKLIEQFAPPSLIVDAEGHIVHLSPKAGRFLHFGGGELSRNLLKLVHPMLRLELRAALFRAAETSAPVEVRGVPVEFEAPAPARAVDISVRPVPEFAPGFMLVVLKEQEPDSCAGTGVTVRPAAPDEATRALERELEIAKENQRIAREEHSASIEEMKAANEELHAMNEELRSASEELETSREELQSINEELVTVNLELATKVEQLARSNSDAQNLMAATNVAIIFLDQDLQVMRYTAPAVALFHLIASDIGRPLGDLRHRFEFDFIMADAEAVLKDTRPIERSIRSHDGLHFLARTTAYRTVDNHVAGIVLTFVDVTPLKKAAEAVRESEARFRGIIDQTAAGVCLADLSGRITFANPHLALLAGCSQVELVGRKLSEFVATGGEAGYQLDLARLAIEGTSLDVEMCLQRPGAEPVWCSVNIAAIRDAHGEQSSCVAVFVDISRRKAAEEALRSSQTSSEDLENKVQQRTSELQQRTSELQQRTSELQQRTSELQQRTEELGVEAEERKRAEALRTEMMHAVLAAQEDERGRISRELHDEIGQHVTALILGLKALQKELPRKSAQLATIQSLQVISETIGRDIHEVALELRPTALDDLGLVRAFSTFLEDWAARSHLEVAFDHAGLGEGRLPKDLETILYRVLCESIRNVVKHAQAKSVSVILQRNPGQVVAVVEDDGVGFDVASTEAPGAAKRLGLVGMKERVALANGEIKIESKPRRGATVIVRLPLAADENRK